jgi:nicotinamide phosphoribosyltransferase
MNTLAALQKDAYKIGHVFQYPNGTEYIYSNFTARSGKHSNVPGSTGIYFIGLQYFIQDYLINEWNDTFFNQPKEAVITKYQKAVSRCVGYEVNVDHIAALHDLGYLPLLIKALPEGSFVPYGVPVLTIINTKPEFYFLSNMIETVLSCELWLPITSATSFMAFRTMSLEYSQSTCDDDSFVPFQNHDFSMRGMQGRHAAAISGFALLACGGFGTDTLPAVELAIDYYDADESDGIIGCSVNATEHSVMTAGGIANELDTFNRLLTEVYPTGILSVVSDSYDFWQAVTEFLPQLKAVIESRDGKLVIRPDSGDPVKIISGVGWYNEIHQTYEESIELSGYRTEIRVITEHEHKGLIECLWDIFGGTINTKGYKVLNPKIGAIYGDSITLKVQEQILANLRVKGFASSNVVFGIGSYTLSHVTRDTHGMAMKTTWAQINGEAHDVFKDPKTDSGIKKSAKGLLMVSQIGNTYQLNEQVEPKAEKHGCLIPVFNDGVLVKKYTLKEVRETANSYL